LLLLGDEFIWDYPHGLGAAACVVRTAWPYLNSSAASALVSGRCWRIASRSSSATTARAAAIDRSIRLAR
jgi:hypothetical protein